MPDNPHQLDQAERIRRLQERRAASGRTPRPVATASTPVSDTGTATTLSAQPRNARQRRPHPAAATRLLLAGLSVASFFAIGGTVAVANLRSVAATTAANATATGTVPGATSATPRATGATTQVVAVAHTTTGGSLPPP